MTRRLYVTLAVAGLMVGLLAPGSAVAGAGSRIGGVVWADTNRDGARQPAEPTRSGVTVELLTSPGGAVTASTTTNASGAYSFANAADGDHVVRVVAPGAFRFPGAAGGANDFAREGQPNPGEPERGVSAPVTIVGATQVTGLDAGLQPIADLRLEQLALPNACDGLAQTGTPPFDAADGPGLDTGTANCVIRTGDTVRQQYAVSLTGLPSGTSVPNVVVELVVSSPDGAALQLAGPGANGLPAGCLSAANGASPASGRALNPDGSITVTCNVGTMSSNVAALEITYRVTTSSAVPSHATIGARAYAGQGDAGTSATLTGPTVEVTGKAEWDIRKISYIPFVPATETIGGEAVRGFYTDYQISIFNMAGATGGGQLDWPVTFTDRMTEFPNAIVVSCRPNNLSDTPAVRSPWTLTCPLRETAGTDGWQLSLGPNNPTTGGGDAGFTVMRVFVPEADLYRTVDPDWQPGDERPIGTSSWENHAEDTDGWTMRGGQPNYGTGFEPGWDGAAATGNNLVNRTQALTEPRWDLAKGAATNPSYTTRTIDGQPVVGYEIWYNLNVTETNGAVLAPFVDDVTFQDVMTSHPDAHLIQCRTNPSFPSRGTTTCETGPQPSDGWQFHFVPNQTGIDNRQGLMQALFFIPADAIAVDPCLASPTDTFRIRNEARDTDGWTAGGEPINGTGLEPGWDATSATGNNVVDRTWTIRSTVGDCGTYTGNKVWTFNPTVAWAGRQMGTAVAANASNDRVSIPDLTVCDVFDVSVLFLADVDWYGPGTFTRLVSSGTIDQADYVVEYAEGPNETRTQAPTDFTSIQDAAAGCHEHDGPWETSPTAFGEDWQDTVNMIRVRPIDPDHVQTGPFSLQLEAQLTTRGFYNGGPNAGEAIPSGVQVTNVGGWTQRGNPDSLAHVTRQVPFRGMQLGISKAAQQAQYLPGDTARWNLQVWIDQATVGSTMRNVRVVDTLPAGLLYDAACTQDLLPAGVTATHDPVTNVVTFRFGDVAIGTAPRHWIAGGGGKPFLQVCTTVPTLAQPGDLHRNNVQAFGDNSENAPTAAAQLQIAGAGQLGIVKSVDKSYVASGEGYEWSLEWGNTSTVISFQNPDVIDVLPWNGDGDPASGSARDQLASDYTGLARLVGPVAAPTYLRGGTGAVPGTWYYSTAAPATLSHDPRDATNADPAAAGGRWLTAAEVADFADVSAVRFVSSTALPVQSRVRAQLAAESTSSTLDNLYVNRAMIFSATVPDQPLLSNEPYVLMPGFTLGDLVWIDRNGNGRLDAGEQGVPGVTVQVRDTGGDVVATRTTDAQGRWSVAALPAGDYTVHVPASMFATSGPLADHVVRTVGSGDTLEPNETADNNNTAAADPAATGLTSTPVTLGYVHAGGRLVGGNGPSGDDVAGLAGELIADSFTTFTVDLAVMPAPRIDIEKATNGHDADTPTGPFVVPGSPVTWTYVVTNTGGVDLTDVTVTDDRVDAAAIDCDGTGGNVVAGPLAPGASFTCVATGTAVEGQYANLGTVTAQDPAQEQVTDEDPSHYLGAVPAVDIEKATNGDDADQAPGVSATAGAVVEWTYVITNTGNVPLTNLVVTDDREPASAIACDGTSSNVFPGPLAPGASFSCTAQGIAIEGAYANIGTVVGEATGLDTTVTDTDPSHYVGTRQDTTPTTPSVPTPSTPPPSTPTPHPTPTPNGSPTSGQSGTGLPDTGAPDVTRQLLGGALLTLLGLILVVLGRRRRA